MLLCRGRAYRGSLFLADFVVWGHMHPIGRTHRGGDVSSASLRRELFTCCEKQAAIVRGPSHLGHISGSLCRDTCLRCLSSVVTTISAGRVPPTARAAARAWCPTSATA